MEKEEDLNNVEIQNPKKNKRNYLLMAIASIIVIILGIFIIPMLIDLNSDTNKNDTEQKETDNNNPKNEDNKDDDNVQDNDGAYTMPDYYSENWSEIYTKTYEIDDQEVVIKYVDNSNNGSHSDIDFYVNDKLVTDVPPLIYLMNKFYVIDNLLLFYKLGSDINHTIMIFVDFNGNVVKEIGPNNVDSNYPDMKISSTGYDNKGFEIDGNKIIIATTSLTHASSIMIDGSSISYCDNEKMLEYNLNDQTIVYIRYELIYDGTKFSDLKIIETQTLKEYLKDNNFSCTVG